MPTKVVYFGHLNPYPPRSGTHKRYVELFNSFRKLNCETVFASSSLYSDVPWTNASVQGLQQEYGVRVRLYEPHRFDWAMRKALRGMLRFRLPVPVDFFLHTPPRMLRWFEQVVEQEQPDVLMTSYASYDGLVAHERLGHIQRIIDTNDLAGLNSRMQRQIKPYLPSFPMHMRDVSDEWTDLDFYRKHPSEPEMREFAIFDRYDYTIAVSQKEANLMQKHTHKTQVIFLPVVQRIPAITNTYSAPPVFTTGPNQFNTQGYFTFAKHILPLIKQQHPDFTLHMTGTVCNFLPEDEQIAGIVRRGFVDDLSAVYAEARFAISPVFGGTGQQVKVVEAMAHGLPVVIWRAMEAASPVRDGENGFVADDAQAFAEAIVRLDRDPALCRRMGNAARATIAEKFSEQHMLDILRPMMQPKPKM